MNRITELRKAGKFEEALTEATQRLEENPTDPTVQKEKAWVHYAFIKQAAETSNILTLEKHLDQLLNLDQTGDAFFGNRLGWQIVKIQKSLRQNANIPYERLARILDKAMQFSYDREDPICPDSGLLRAALRVRDYYPNLQGFMDWWDIDHLKEDDFRPFELPGGKSIMALAEQAYITYARLLRQLAESGIDGAQDRIRDFLPKLEALMERYPEYTYPPYYRTQLLIALGQYDEVFEQLLPFIRQKPGEFWVWSNLGDVFAHQEEPIKAIACYAKAISGKAKPSFLVKVKEKLGEVLLSQDRLSEAKTEFEDAIRIRMREWRSLPPSLVEIQNSDWYQQSVANANNYDVYRQYSPMAEALVYEDFPEEVGVVLHVDPRKHQAWVRVSREVSARVKFFQLRERVSPGDFVAVRMEERQGQDGVWYKVLTIRKTDQLPDPDIIKEFSGVLSLRGTNPFGFVNEEIFVPQHLVEKYRLRDEQSINGLAAINYDSKGDKWSWKALTVDDAAFY